MTKASEPERTCVGCRQRGPKGALIRIVMGDDGPRIDANGPGRGAYLHRSGECLERVALRKVLPKALRTGVGSDGAARLETEIVRLLEEH